MPEWLNGYGGRSAVVGATNQRHAGVWVSGLAGCGRYRCRRRRIGWPTTVSGSKPSLHARAPTLFTSNLGPGELGAARRHTVSRIIEMCGVFVDTSDIASGNWRGRHDKYLDVQAKTAVTPVLRVCIVSAASSLTGAPMRAGGNVARTVAAAGQAHRAAHQVDTSAMEPWGGTGGTGGVVGSATLRGGGQAGTIAPVD